MSFVKDPLNATEPREIIEYSQDLEDRVEDGFDTLVTGRIKHNIPLRASSGWSGTLSITEIGGLGYQIEGQLTVGTTTNNTIIADIPIHLRPLHPVIIPYINNNTGENALGITVINGALRVYTPFAVPTGNVIRFSHFYVTT